MKTIIAAVAFAIALVSTPASADTDDLWERCPMAGDAGVTCRENPAKYFAKRAAAPANEYDTCNSRPTLTAQADCIMLLHGVITEKAKKAAQAKMAARPGIKIGMTQEQALASQWGKPISVNRTTTAHGVREQWVYNSKSYLYFDNGILTAIQN
jgi:hypothetical protein